MPPETFELVQEEFRRRKAGGRYTSGIICKEGVFNTEIGDINRKRQRLLEKTIMDSTTHYNQKIWIMECLDCFHRYGSNGCDAFQRKCPKHDGGKAGEPI
jgi:hypothetical protein